MFRNRHSRSTPAAQTLAAAFGSEPACRAPERSAVGERIQLVEKHAAIPQRLALVIDVRRLPLVDRLAPLCGVQQPIASDFPGIVARGSVEIRVAAIPLSSFAELHHGKIPCDHHGDDLLFAGTQRETQRDGAGQFFLVADPRFCVVGEPPVLGEWRPHCLAIALRQKCGLIGHFHARAFPAPQWRTGRPIRWRASRAVRSKTMPFIVPAPQLSRSCSSLWLPWFGVPSKSRVKVRNHPAILVHERRTETVTVLIGRIVCVPAINRHRVTGFAIVVRHHGRKLLQRHVSGKFFHW